MEKELTKKDLYNKIYQRCLYDARKQLVERHHEEYKKVLDQLLLEQGIVSRTNREQYIKTLRGGHND